MGEVLNDQVADKNSSKYHTIDICPNLQPVKKDYQTNAPEHQPNANYWIKEVDKEGDETRYKIQHVIANGPRELYNGLAIEIANDETDREHLIITSPILKSNENKNIDATV
ncbi:unnamed protein product, partial [Rotaria sp. Silwood1]